MTLATDPLSLAYLGGQRSGAFLGDVRELPMTLLDMLDESLPYGAEELLDSWNEGVSQRAV